MHYNYYMTNSMKNMHFPEVRFLPRISVKVHASTKTYGNTNGKSKNRAAIHYLWKEIFICVYHFIFLTIHFKKQTNKPL